MKTAFARLILSAVLVALPLAAAPTALAQEHGEEESGGGISFLGGPEWESAKEVTIWSMVGVSVFAATLGVLYLFKRRVGGFPEHPSWVAPISIMPASELPGDDDDGHDRADSHGSHAAAH